MNRQEPKVRTTAPGTPRLDNSPPAMRRKRPAPKLLSMMRRAMLVLAGAIIVTGLLLILLPMFRVRTVEVVGDISEANKQMILENCGIAIGDEMLSMDTLAVIDRINENCRFLDPSETVVTRYFNKIRISVTEYKNPIYTEYQGKYYLLNNDLLVLGEYESAESLGTYLPVSLPAISRAEVGKFLVFADAATDMSYVGTLVKALDSADKLSRVTLVDCSKKYAVSYLLDGNCLVRIGKVGDMATKLELADRILEEKAGAGDTYAVVDVSDLQKPTYRQVEAEEITGVGMAASRLSIVAGTVAFAQV